MDNVKESISNIYSQTTPYISSHLSKSGTVAKIALLAIALILIFDIWPAHLCGVGVITSLSSGSALFFFSTGLILSHQENKTPPSKADKKALVVPQPSPVSNTLPVDEVDETDLVLLGPANSSNLIAIEKAGFSLTSVTALEKSNIATFGGDMSWDKEGMITQPVTEWLQITEGGYYRPLNIQEDISLLKNQLDVQCPKKIMPCLLRICTLGNAAQKAEAKKTLEEIKQLYAKDLHSEEEEKTDLEEEEKALMSQVGLIGQKVKGELPTERGDEDTECATIVGIKRSDGTVRYALLYKENRGLGKCIVGTDLASGRPTEKDVHLNTLYIFDDIETQTQFDKGLWEKMQKYLSAFHERIASNSRKIKKLVAEKALVDTFPALFDHVKLWNLSADDKKLLEEPFPLIWGIRSFSQNMVLGKDIPVVYTKPEVVLSLQQWFDKKRCPVKVLEMKESTALLNRVPTDRFLAISNGEL